MLPEYSVHLPTYENVFDPESKSVVRTLKTTKRIRGWREVLMMALRACLIRKSDLDLLFPEGHVRKSWWEQLKSGPIEKRDPKRNRPLIQLAN